jgi:exodeoxyribonuclease V beta subunit
VSARRVGRPAVLRGVPLDRHTVVEASAGTGKTFTLEHLVVEILLATDVTFDQLLVVTFTEKATNELRTRVRAKLEDLLAGRGERATDEQVRAGDFWTIDNVAREKLARALHGFDGATIATIHAFCHRVLRENAFATGRLFDEQQVDGRQAFGRALRDALRHDLARDPARSRWLEAALRAGWSIQRVEQLLWDCTLSRGGLRPPLEAARLDAALEAFPIDDARGPRIAAELKAAGTHASTTRSIVRKLGEVADAVERSLQPHDAAEYVLEASSLDLAALVEKLEQLRPGPGQAARACRAVLDLARVTPPFPAALANALFSGVREELARTKLQAGRYDFDDMLSLVDEALGGPRGGAYAEAMREKWRYALIDEFQDTDQTQWSIFRRAFFERKGAGPSTTLFLVGDPKQSIYRFRGADVFTYLRARDEVVASGGARVPLERNYRATRALVAASNALFDQRAAEPFFTGDIEYTPVECGRPDRTLVDGDGRAVSPVQVFRFRGLLPLPALGARIAREILAITDLQRPWKFDGRPLEHRHVFVLTRTAREGRTIGAALREAGVPHAFFKEDGLFQTSEAKDVRAVLAAIDDPSHRPKRLAAWLTPFFGLTLAALEGARELSASDPLVGRLHYWKAFAEARDFDRLFESVLSGSGILRREIFFADGERELTNYLHLFELLLERARETHATLRELVHELSGLIARTRLPLDLEGNVQRLESERQAVQIMTIHKSKGLEAPVVFVAGGVWAPRPDEVRAYHEGGHRLAWVGRLAPRVKPIVLQEEREEDERLMYVALTRAMGRIYLPCLVDESGGAPKRLRGAYDAVNRRVVAELAEPRDPTLAVEDVAGEASTPAMAHRPEADPWRPSAACLPDEDSSAVYASLRERHAGVTVTSYTRLRGQRSGARGAWSWQAVDRTAEKAVEALDDAAPPTLRGARTSGIFLHELLERVPLASFDVTAGFDLWRARTDVATLFDEGIAVHRVDRAERGHAERLVWGAYTTGVTLPGGDRVTGFAAAERIVREMDFVYPIPEPEHPPLGDDPAAPLAIRHGYVRGSLDLAFEHRGATYFVDWKSDSLDSYAPERLGAHVAAHYDEQVKLYALAVVKLLGPRARAGHQARFGGILYCFLRGFDGRGNGIWAARPAWSELRAWDDDLRARRHWTGGRGS